MKPTRRKILSAIALAAAVPSAFAAAVPSAFAEKKYGPGVSDSEIKIGNIAPYSGPASAFAAVAKTEAAYFQMVNEQGGVRGRKINFVSYDDGYSPPKTVEQARKLVESDEVFLLFNVIGTPGNAAIQRYVNARKVPHLFISSGGNRWNDPKNFPWSMTWWPAIRAESRVYAKYILQNHPGKRIGILYQNDDLGKDYLTGLREAFGADAAKLIAVAVPYELTDPTVDSQVVRIRSANPDIFINITTPKFAVQAIRKVGELGWKPIHFVSMVAQSTSNVMRVAGFEHAQGIITAGYLKDPGDPALKDDPGVVKFKAFMAKYYPDGDREDTLTIFGYGAARALVQVLAECGDDLTRENVMRKMTSLNLESDVFLPGIRITTSANDYSPIKQMRLMRFTGQRFERFGSLLDSN